ncbi:hypothetical protein BC834DRAFT_971111 [Gloeopeniophorella convolvens]|nr:hypothetical protein BC834DRAFT_971111 [Gloeopeniophorella convolvens]
MAPKGGNAKKESGRAKKAENEASKRAAAEEAKERAEASKWSDGSKLSKSAKEDKEEKRRAELARKAENARLLAEEEASTSLKKAAPKAGAKKATKPAPKPAGPGAIAAGGELEAASPTPATPEDSKDSEGPREVESYAATGIDNALELLEVVTAKVDKASIGTQAASIEKHPERRFKAAFNAYVDRELPNIREEQPGLRLQQYKDLLYKQFQKSPENPFNQTLVEYNASNEEKVEVLRKRQDEIRDRLREKS